MAQIMKIAVDIGREEEKFAYSDYNSWEEVMKEGWEFLGLDDTNCAVMKRNGYINRWKMMFFDEEILI